MESNFKNSIKMKKKDEKKRILRKLNVSFMIIRLKLKKK